MAYEHLNYPYLILKNVKNNKKIAVYIGMCIRLYIACSKISLKQVSYVENSSTVLYPSIAFSHFHYQV